MYKLTHVEDCEFAVKTGLARTGYALTGKPSQEASTEKINLTLQRGEHRATLVVHPTALEWSIQDNAETLTVQAMEHLRHELSECGLRITDIHLL